MKQDVSEALQVTFPIFFNDLGGFQVLKNSNIPAGTPRKMEKSADIETTLNGRNLHFCGSLFPLGALPVLRLTEISAMSKQVRAGK
jgi:hypothetical protein